MKNLGIKGRISICLVIVFVHFLFNAWLFSPNDKFDTTNVVHWMSAVFTFFCLFLYNKIINGVWFHWNVKFK